jgi:hypothetical protein
MKLVQREDILLKRLKVGDTNKRTHIQAEKGLKDHS